MESAEQIAIRDLETKIRDFISHPRRQDPLLQDKPLWNVLCSSLDILGDTELAIESYLALPEGDDVGTRYLLVYGILQVLYVQQDAIEDLVKSFGLAYKSDSALVEIRDARNKTTGHPTKRGNARTSKDGQQTSHFLARYSIRKSSYKLMTSFGGPPKRIPGRRYSGFHRKATGRGEEGPGAGMECAGGERNETS
jgi:hypothetical protein